ncbi:MULTISPECIES: helix-turn-helix domain-containing protein [Cyanophyceae]|uniref:helix-turn-helix domain-containing protein n=1 Tax=Cyanophyceae TaxID=3028117 RepID=UPI001684BFC5|nr:hypothetical protein [Trichocoleus sp. FACHB-69]MBD1930599.1 hypothetical protein [Trichocoleus sp. FACHB-69]
MSVRKLSESDKREILNLYRQPGETTSTLATRYDVSNSTISRLLKNRLSEKEYEGLIQQKRATRSHSSVSEPTASEEDEPQETLPETFAQTEKSEEPSAEIFNSERRRRRRSSVESSLETIDTTEDEEKLPSSELLGTSSEPLFEVAVDSAQTGGAERLDDDNYAAEVEASVIEEMLLEDLRALDNDEDDEDDEDDDEDADLEDLEDEDWDDDPPTPKIGHQRGMLRGENREGVQVLPLSNAVLPKICYLVVDRAAELISRPLKEFSDLGQIPPQEFQQRTLPVFDNHRVARRFSNRTQRVIKVPDGKMLQKTCSQLQAKGITRLLIDGQVYSL